MTDLKLYPDQAELMARVRKSMRHYKSVLLQAAPGFGKTACCIDMMRGAHAKGSTLTMLVPRKELLAQTIESMNKYRIPFGVISPGYTPNPFAKIQIAMTPTYARRMDSLAVPQILVIDECHIGGADLDRIIARQRAARLWTIGMSATPMKMNGKAMGDWYDHMECGPFPSELIKAGRLSKYRYFAPSRPDLSGIRSSNGDYVQTELASYMESQAQITGDIIRDWKANLYDKISVGFATSRKHAGMMVESFAKAGIQTAMIDGTMGPDERRRIIRAFARREFSVLWNVQILQFGFDLSQASGMDVTIEGMIDANPTQSLPLQVQKWFRTLRAKPEAAIFNDHAGNVERHGFPDDDRDWSLDGMKKGSRESGERTIPTRSCPDCYFVHKPTPTCPNCGNVYPVEGRMVEEVDGVLEEISDVRRISPRQEQGMAKDLQSLLALGRKKGMQSPKLEYWAAKVLSGREAKQRIIARG